MNAINPGDILLERYRVLRPLGAGGFGCTFEVDCRGATMVLKVLKLGEFLDPASQEQIISLFQREAKVLSQLRHPGIPRVEPDAYFTYRPNSFTEPLHCLVMEKIEGKDLEAWLDSRDCEPISEELALDWLKQLAEILDKLHQQQYFHRDIKPANIIIKPSGSLALIDFGAVKEITNTFLVKISAGKPGTGVMSPGYTPFEQSNGKAVPQSDFFAVGRTMVHLLTGKSPLEFDEDPNFGKLLWREEVPAVSERLADFIDYLMAPFPGNRPLDARAILDGLESLDFAGSPSPVSYFPNPPAVWGNQWPNPPVGSPAGIGATQVKPGGSVEAEMLTPDPTINGEAAQMPGAIAHSSDLSPNLSPNLSPDKEAKPGKPRILVYWGKSIAKLGLGLGLLGAISWPWGAPQIASALNRSGYDRYTRGDIKAAKSYFLWAVRLNPEFSMARYNLGSACEDSSELDCARREYQKATEGGDRSAVSLALNNLGRLYAVREKDYKKAIDLLLRGLKLSDRVKTRSALHKNLGLAYFGQGKEAAAPCPYYIDAETHLEKAINLVGERSDASELLAKVRVEKQKCLVSTAAPPAKSQQ